MEGLVFLWIMGAVVALVCHFVRRRKATGRQASQERAREIAEREAEVEKRHQNDKAALAQRRRNAAIAAVLREFSLLTHQMGERFTQQMLDDYMSRFMSDAHPVEEVEAHRDQLVAMFRKHASEADEQSQLRTVEDLAVWYQDQQSRIKALPVDEQLKNVLTIRVNQRYQELSERLFDEMAP